MNNSNSRDVQDLIAEFVSSKNQLLHEEIISSIKRESFANQLEEESSQVDISSQATETPVQKPAEDIGILNKKIEQLTERNLELQQELTIVQMQESQTVASGKPIGADELRMEFLNFTSAHIQQFNTRIKKTEELIETQILKNQGPSEKKVQRDYPVWLFWANTAALGLIAIYFIFQLFSGNGKEATPSQEAVAKTVVTAEVSAKPASTTTDKPKELTENNTPKEVVAALPAAEPAATPFHNTAQPAMTETALEDRNVPAKQVLPAQKTGGMPAAVNKTANNIQAGHTTINTAAAQTRPAAVKAPVKAPQQQSQPVTATKSASQQKSVVTTANTKVQTEKKASDKEKVYFGED